MKKLFTKYQKYLLAFANTKYGRGYLSLEKWVGIKDDLPIVKVTPDSIHQIVGWKDRKTPIIRAVFIPKSQYLKKFLLSLQALELCSDVLGKVRNPEFVIPHF